MKKIKPIRILAGSILILAMILGITGVAYGHVVSQKVDTGAAIWEVRSRVWIEDSGYPNIYWRGGHTTKSYYQSNGNNYPIAEMRIRGRLYTSPDGKEGNWYRQDEDYDSGYHRYLLTADTKASWGFLPNHEYGRSQTTGYFKGYGGTIWSMTSTRWYNANGKPIYPRKDDTHWYHDVD